MNHLRLFRLPRFLAPWDRYLPVMWTVCVGVAFSLAVFCTVRWCEYQKITRVFQLAAEDRALAVKGTFETEAAMLELVRSSLNGDAHPRRNEFRRLVTPFLSHSRSIKAVEWVPRVAESERAKFVAAARRDGIEDFRITEMGRDEETGIHVRRVGLVSEVLARSVGWSVAEVDCIRQAAPMHDVGKIGIPDAILRKPGKLTPEEFEVMKTHTSIGARMLADSDVPMLQMAEQIAIGHHERWDGRGYPNGLAGQDIPECARIVAIADVFDALTHARVYKPAMSEDEALTVMRSEAGTQFDSLLLTHFFLHLPEIHRIAREHPDEDRGLPAVAVGIENLEQVSAT